ncbi:Dabb family protein [Puia sp.]|uniref:Dabb family protein n=1 Tax=Puia sp. TaxID=2045100 RepID=UPI002F42CB54
MKRRKFLGASALTAGALGMVGTVRGVNGLAEFAGGSGGNASAGTTGGDTSAGAAGGEALSGAGAKRPPVVHHVFFWLKNPQSVEDRDKLVAGLKTLGGIPLIKELHVGVLADTEKRDVVDSSWQVSELMFFDDLAGQKNYQDHPLHQAFIKNCSHLWAKVVVYDAMTVFTRL